MDQIEEGPRRVFDDGTLSFRLTDEEALSIEVDHYEGLVGIPGPKGWDELENCYSYDDENKTITIDGRAIGELYPDYDAPDRIGVQITGHDAEGNLLFIAGHNDVQFWYAHEELDLEEHRDFLPHWDGSINDTLNVYVENSDYPDGEDLEAHVTDVEVLEGRDLLEEFKEDSDSDHRWWHYRAGENFGNVKLRVSYVNYDGTNKTFDAFLHIKKDVYEINMDSEGGRSMGLPGTGINLIAFATHKYWDGDHEDETTEGLAFNWKVDQGQEFAEVNSEQGDSSSARVDFYDLAEGEEWIDENCRVILELKDANSDNPEETKATEFRWFQIKSEYQMIYPTEINIDLQVGETEENVNFEVREYRYGAGEGYNNESYKTYEIQKTEWFYDDNALLIRDSKGDNVGHDQALGDTYSFTKKSEWETGIMMKAYYLNDNKDLENIDAGFWFNRLEYDIWFEDYDVSVYNDSSWSFELSKRDDLNYDNLNIEYRATGFKWDEEGEYAVPDDCWSADGYNITVYGDKIAAAGLDELRFEAEVFLGDRSLGKDADCRVELKRACPVHFWLSGPEEYFNDRPKGIQKKMCWICGEKKIVELDRTSIAKATVSGIADKVYTGKKITQAPKVVVGGKTLKAGTNYTVTYSANQNVGTATMTITGNLAYTGTIKKTFKILPKATTVSKIAAAQKAFTVTWKKQATQTTGYELQYALNNKFTSGAKTLNITKTATVSRKVTGLKAKKKYYVRVRTYKTVSGKKIYSAWSPAKYVTTK